MFRSTPLAAGAVRIVAAFWALSLVSPITAAADPSFFVILPDAVTDTLPPEVIDRVAACTETPGCAVDDIPDAAEACAGNLIECAARVGSSALFRLVAPCVTGPLPARETACPPEVRDLLDYNALEPFIVQYISFLDQQANYRTLPNWFVSLPSVRAAFPGVDLTAIRYAESVDTLLPGIAFTFGNDIYFPVTLDLTTSGHVRWMLHEITHVRQYLSGGPEFLRRYFGGAAVAGNVDYEIEAETHAILWRDAVLGDIRRLLDKTPR